MDDWQTQKYQKILEIIEDFKFIQCKPFNLNRKRIEDYYVKKPIELIDFITSFFVVESTKWAFSTEKDLKDIKINYLKHLRNYIQKTLDSKINSVKGIKEPKLKKEPKKAKAKKKVKVCC